MFNSRNPAYRNPTGAVPAKSPVHFRINVSRDLKCSAARVVVQDDNWGQTENFGMFWCGMDGENHEWWECHFTPKAPGLYFYRFYIDTWRGTLELKKGFGGEGSTEAHNGPWQLTVYDPSFDTPHWMTGGIMYQIFPDRFYNSGTPKANVPQDRKLHEHWGEQPDWKPDERGIITNSDYFGGDLKGIEEKLPYLESLGVTCIYLNPIFEAHSNHRYNTADYSKIDPLLGTEADFQHLCAAAKKRGMHVIVDGVFNHTGSDSIYFNREKRYPVEGAYNSQQSPYSSWYNFHPWPNQYDCWWNFDTLPDVNECAPSYNDYIKGTHGIIRKWLALGADGWRLDVADELPDEFLENLRDAAKAEKPDAVILGEVWEDASNKEAYGQRRKYFQGHQLDSVMNYPFRNAILGFLTGADAANMMEIIMNIVENYPPQVLRLLMNHIGTHDTERAITVLAGEPMGNHGRDWQSSTHLSRERRQKGLRLMRLAALMQYTLPGVPCIYYGDEAGLEGYRDPFNRGCYPWGHENEGLVEWYRRLARLRKSCPCLNEGIIYPLMAGDHCMAYIRDDGEQRLLVAINAGEQDHCIYLPPEWHDAEALIGKLPDERSALFLPPLDCVVLKWSYPAPKEKPAQPAPGPKDLQ